MKKAIIFDLDGTLIDSVGDIVDMLNLTAGRFNLNTVDKKTTLEAIGYGSRHLLKDTICKDVSDDEFEKIFEFFIDVYSNAPKPKTALYDGIKEAVIELKKRGFALAVLTNKPQSATDLVNRTLLKDLPFDAVVGQRKGVPTKPHKDSTKYLLNFLEVEPTNCYMVGDMATDLLTAQNSGLQPISALWGYGKKSDLCALGATVFAQNPLSLLDLIK